MSKYNVVDLFAGVGGLSYGFSIMPEFDILLANELEKDISVAYSLNHPDVKMLNCNINELNNDNLQNVLNGKKVDIIVGGPPCQSYSTLGKRKMDERANLFMQYKRVLQILNPIAFVFENVVGILSMNKGQLFRQVKAEFEDLGYVLKYKVLDAASFGVPQHRERVILVGFRDENDFEYPEPTHGSGLKPFITLKDSIGDLPVLKSGETKDYYDTIVYNDFLKFVRKNAFGIVSEHSAPKNAPHLIRIMETLKDGQTKQDLPENIRPKSGYGNTYAKLWWNKPSTTITRNFACPSSSRCIHPRDSRALTIREGARLQSFPDDYQFYGSSSMKRLEIGNAVPPLLSIAISKQILKAFSQKK